MIPPRRGWKSARISFFGCDSGQIAGATSEVLGNQCERGVLGSGCPINVTTSNKKIIYEKRNFAFQCESFYKKSHWKGLPASSQGYRRREGRDAKLISVRNTIDEKRSRYRQGLGFFPINKWIHQRSFFHRHQTQDWKAFTRQYFFIFCLTDFFKFISLHTLSQKLKETKLLKES